MIQRRLLLDPNSEVGGDVGGNAPAAGSNQFKVSVPKAVPAEVSKMEFKIDPSMVADNAVSRVIVEKEGASNVPPPVKEETAPVQPTKQPEVAKAEPDGKAAPVVPAVKAEPVKQTTPAEPEPIMPRKKGVANEPIKEFDYTGYNDDEVAVLKQMSTSAKDFTVGLLKKNKELEAVKSGTFAQHPDAYVIDPTFRAIQEDAHYLNKEAEYWKAQLIKIEGGEKWRPLKGFDKNGEPVLGDERIPTTEDKHNVNMMMQRGYTMAQNKSGELQQFAATYKERVAGDSRAIQAERIKRFGWVSKPEILKETVTLDNGTEQTVEQIRNTLISLFPPYMRHTQGVEVAADLFAAIQIYGQELRETRAGKTNAEVKIKEVARAEPTSARGIASEASKKINGVAEFSLAGLPK